MKAIRERKIVIENHSVFRYNKLAVRNQIAVDGSELEDLEIFLWDERMQFTNF